MAEALDLRIEEGECATFSPDSERFRKAYSQVRPRSAAEVREVLGLSAAASEAAQNAAACCRPGSDIAVTASADDLESEDADVRLAARAATYAAFNAYVHGANPSRYEHLTPAFDRYLDLNKAIINIIGLNDIEVFDGATLTISNNTHVVRARKIIIHPRGRIVCRGSTTFKVTSVEGMRLSVKDTVKLSGSAAVTAARKK